MNILYLLYFNPDGLGSNSAHVKGVIKSFVGLGHNVTLISPGCPEDLKEDVAFKEVPQLKFKGVISFSFALFVIPLLIKYLWKYKPDFIYVRYNQFMSVPCLISKFFFKIPVIVEHNADIETEHIYYNRSRIKRLIIDSFERLFLRLSDGSIVVTKGIVDNWKQKYDIDKLNWVHLNNAVDTDVYKPIQKEKAIDSLGLSPKYEYLVYAGSLTEYQGVEILIEAFEKVHAEKKDIKLIIVGGGDKEINLLSQLVNADTRGNIIFTGQVSEEMCAQYISTSTLCFAPYTSKVSLNDMPPFYGSPMKGDPLKIYSYMACKKPVIASYYREAGALIDQINAGKSVIPNDVENLTKVTLDLLDNEEQLYSAGAKGYNYVVNNSTWDHVGKKTIELYTKALKS